MFGAEKTNIGKLQAPDGLDNIIVDEGFEQLSISFFHDEQAGSLPSIHRDPFDRMLVAQAQPEGLEIITADSFIPRYAVKVVNSAL